MAFEFTGSAEILRIVELLTKVLSPSELPNYYLAIDNNSDDQTYKVSLSALLALGGGSFNDAVFEIYNNTDNTKKLNLSLASISTSTTVTLTIPDISGLIAVAGMLDDFSFGGQAHGGDHVQTFSASTTFDAQNGNNQEMVVTASTTIGITNELPGTYIFTLEIDSVASPTITIGASFGTAVDNNATLINADNDINIITLVVRPDLTKYYTINTITA